MNDEKIIAGLLSNPTVAEAAKSLGLTPQTVYNRLRDDAFRVRYAEARQQVLTEDCYKLQSYLSAVIDQIYGVAIDETGTATQIRLNACDMLLRHCYRLTEITDILSRLEKLEAALVQDNQNG